MRSSKPKRKIAVIGAGYAGSSFCLAALSRNLDERFEIILFEQSKTSGPVGAFALLQPSGECVLKKLGLFDETLRSELHLYDTIIWDIFSQQKGFHTIFRSRKYVKLSTFSESS